MRTSFLKHINFILLMLVTGVFWGTWFTMTRSIGIFSAEEFIHIGKVIISNVANPMKILMALTMLLLIVNTWTQYRIRSRAFYPFLASSIFMVFTLLITLLVEVPIDNQIKTWSTASIPVNWEAIRDHWAWYHGLRTVTSIASFAAFSFGAVVLGVFRFHNPSYENRCGYNRCRNLQEDKKTA